jgi:hypothetical protein
MHKELFILTIERNLTTPRPTKLLKGRLGNIWRLTTRKSLSKKTKRKQNVNWRKKKTDHSKGKRFKGNQSHQVEFGAGPTNARSYKGRSGQSVRDGRGGSIRGKNEYDGSQVLCLSIIGIFCQKLPQWKVTIV